MAVWSPTAVLGITDDNKCIGHSIRDASKKCRNVLSVQKASSKHEALTVLSFVSASEVTLEQLRTLVGVSLCHAHQRQARGLLPYFTNEVCEYSRLGEDQSDAEEDGGLSTLNIAQESQSGAAGDIEIAGTAHLPELPSQDMVPGLWPPSPEPSLQISGVAGSRLLEASPQPADDAGRVAAGRSNNRVLRPRNADNRFHPYSTDHQSGNGRPSLSMNLNKRLFRNPHHRSREILSVHDGPRMMTRSSYHALSHLNEGSMQAEAPPTIRRSNNTSEADVLDNASVSQAISSTQAFPIARSTRTVYQPNRADQSDRAASPSTQDQLPLGEQRNNILNQQRRAKGLQVKARQARQDFCTLLLSGNNVKVNCEDHVVRKAYAGENCPICKEEMVGKDPGALMWCIDGCGQSFHARPECLGKWLRLSTTCPLCRAPWSHMVCACDPWIQEILTTDD